VTAIDADLDPRGEDSMLSRRMIFTDLSQLNASWGLGRECTGLGYSPEERLQRVPQKTAVARLVAT
jgi:hypothetical protein